MACAGCLVALSGFGEDSPAPSAFNQYLPAIIGAGVGAVLGAMAYKQKPVVGGALCGGLGALMGYIVVQHVKLQKAAQLEVPPYTTQPILSSPTLDRALPMPALDRGLPMPALDRSLSAESPLPESASDQQQWSGPVRVTLSQPLSAQLQTQQRMASLSSRNLLPSSPTISLSDQQAAATGSGGGLQVLPLKNVGLITPTIGAQAPATQASCPAGSLMNADGKCFVDLSKGQVFAPSPVTAPASTPLQSLVTLAKSLLIGSYPQPAVQVTPTVPSGPQVSPVAVSAGVPPVYSAPITSSIVQPAPVDPSRGTFTFTPEGVTAEPSGSSVPSISTINPTVVKSVIASPSTSVVPLTASPLIAKTSLVSPVVQPTATTQMQTTRTMIF